MKYEKQNGFDKAVKKLAKIEQKQIEIDNLMHEIKDLINKRQYSNIPFQTPIQKKVDDLFEFISSYLNVEKLQVMVRKPKGVDNIFAKQIVLYFAYKHIAIERDIVYNKRAVAYALGYTNHTTLLISYGNFKGELEVNRKLSKQVEEIEEQYIEYLNKIN